MADVTWLNGNDLADPWPDERAFQYGDGLFETLAVIDGLPCLWDLHLQRLQRGCDRLGLPIPDPGQLRRACVKACRGHAHAALKLYWTAGRSARGYRRPTPVRPTCLMQLAPWAPAAAKAPWHLMICEHRLGEHPGLAGIKHLNRLDQVLGRAEWADDAFDEGLMLGQDDRVVCGTMSNIVLERDGGLFTPALTGAGVAGVVRACLLGEAARRGAPVTVTRLDVEDLRTADAVYLTNALVGVRRVAQCGEFGFDLDRAEPPLLDAVRRLAFRPGLA